MSPTLDSGASSSFHVILTRAPCYWSTFRNKALGVESLPPFVSKKKTPTSLFQTKPALKRRRSRRTKYNVRTPNQTLHARDLKIYLSVDSYTEQFRMHISFKSTWTAYRRGNNRLLRAVYQLCISICGRSITMW
jgi:hypothetical protein